MIVLSDQSVPQAEHTLLALLDEWPYVTVGDLYALSRYLFNLSNAVKQAAKNDSERASVLTEPIEDPTAIRHSQRPQSLVVRWGADVRKNLDAQQQRQMKSPRGAQAS